MLIVFGKFIFSEKSSKYHFDRKRASVDVVAEEEVFGGGGVAAHVEDLQEVVVLAVDVADDGDGVGDVKHVALVSCGDKGMGLRMMRENRSRILNRSDWLILPYFLRCYFSNTQSI
jgi:hypothetical protein